MCQEVVTLTGQVLPSIDQDQDPLEAVEMLTQQYITSTEQLDATQGQLGEVHNMSYDCHVIFGDYIVAN